MHKMDYSIELMEPVIISETSGDQNLTATRDYIPGSVVLGTLAGYIYRNHGKKLNNIIKKFFLDGSLIVTNAYKTKNINEIEYISFPTRSSIESSKNDPNEIVDLLCALSEKKQTKQVGGYSVVQNDRITKVPIKKEINFHHQRDPKTGTSVKGIIFNFEALEKGQVFKGCIYGEQSELNQLSGLLSNSLHIHLGKSRTGQYGTCNLTISDIQDYNADENNYTGDEVVLTTTSDMIIYNENGFSEATAQVFLKYLKEQGINISILEAFIKTCTVEGFNNQWGMHKPVEVCIKAGAAFKLKGDDVSFQKLNELLKNGLGERVNEGFGRGYLSTDIQDKLIENKNNDPKSKPTNEISNETKQLLTEIFERYIIEKARHGGILFAKGIGNSGSLTNSLVSRLYSFAIGSSKTKDFQDKIEGLIKKAKKSLEDIDVTNDESKTEDLFIFLSNIHKSPGKILNASGEYPDSLVNILGYDTKTNSDMNDIITLVYLRSMFLHLRKIVKSKKGGNK